MSYKIHLSTNCFLFMKHNTYFWQHKLECQTIKIKNMNIKELLDQFTLFDSAKGQRAELPAVEGNYIVVLKAGCNIPDVLGNFKYTEISLHGVDYRVLYTGIASDLKRRIWTNHLHGNGGNSTLRKTLGSLFGYQKIPRDKNYQINKKNEVWCGR